jgi:N-carbamoylputrescine amidase
VSRDIRVAVVQHANSGEYSIDLNASIAGIRRAAAQGAQLVLLQELHTGLYFCQVEDTEFFDLAETIPGPTTNTLGDLAKELGLVIVCSLFEKRATGLYHNTAVVLDTDGSIAGKYRKMHIPDDPGYYEKFYFTPGDLGFTPIQTSIAKLGVLVCWDQWYPEAARLMALAGAEILLYPTAIGWNPADDRAEQLRQQEAWITVQRGHAVANNLPVLSANRVGFEADPSGQTEGSLFWGASMIVGWQGELIAQADSESVTEVLATLDLDRTEQVRRWWPYLRDRRIDAYGDIVKRYRD